MARRLASANHMLATWTPGPIASDLDAVRRQWEFGRLTIAGVKLIGFTLLALACAWPQNTRIRANVS